MILNKKMRERFKVVTVILLCLSFGGCGVCDDDSDSAPTLIPDADGDVLSGRTTGIDLPQSIQTVPAESTESRARKIRITQEDLRK